MITEKMKAMLLAEREQPMQWWYLSFAEEEGFRGAVLVRAHGITDAIMLAHALGINPGGEVLPIPFPSGEPGPPEAIRNRLLTEAEVRAWHPDTVKLSDLEAS